MRTMLQINGLLRQGKSKKLYATDDSDLAVMYFKDEAIAYRGLKRGRIMGKGEVNNAICGTLYRLLEEKGIPTAFVRELDPRQSVVKKVEMLPI